jgi:hypothetical protein
LPIIYYFNLFFKEFLKKEFSQENIDFWVKCENFKKIENPLDLKKAADEIWNTYLDTSSMYQINVDSKARGHSKDALIHPNNKMFEMAQTHVNIFFNFYWPFFKLLISVLLRLGHVLGDLI